MLSEAEPSYWAGWWDKPREGTFSDVNTGENLTETMFHPWYLGEPNGDTLENCAIVWPVRNSWNYESCNKQFCGYCEFEYSPDLLIRGKIVLVYYVFDTRQQVFLNPCYFF